HVSIDTGPAILAKATSTATSAEWCDMTREQARELIEASAKHFGLSVEEFSKRVMQELEIKGAVAAGVPDWALDMARAVPTDLMRNIALRDARAPTGPSAQGVIPSSQQMSNVRGTVGVPGSGTGWAREVPLSNPPGINYVDALCIADDIKGRAGKRE